MRHFGRMVALIVLTCTVAPSHAFTVFFRSMPAEGTWAEWKVEANLGGFSPGVTPKIRLVAGKVVQREQHRYQSLEFSGVWEEDSKPYKLKASYEIDLDRLEKNGHPSGAARLVTAYKDVDGEMRELEPGDPLLALYEGVVMSLSDVRIDPQAVRLDDPEILRKCEFNVLKAKLHIPACGGEKARTGNFKAWIGDDVPFGVAKWVMKRKISMGGIGRSTVAVETATLVDFGKSVTATTKPADKTLPTTRAVPEPAQSINRPLVRSEEGINENGSGE
jgi:hypothetical protein